jgi:hypothetical protein
VGRALCCRRQPAHVAEVDTRRSPSAAPPVLCTLQARIKALQPMDSRNYVPCSYFARGLCTKGNACPFLHDPVSPALS